MGKTPANSGKPITRSDVAQVRKLADGNTPTGLIAHKLQRSENSIRAIASDKGITLKPTNQSPYNRRAK